MRRIIKHALSACARYLGVLWAADRLRYHLGGRRRLAILMYHKISADSDVSWAQEIPGMSTTEGTFRRQLRHLRRHYAVLPLREALARLRNGDALPFRCVAITFDDGWKDNYERAWPALREAGLAATVFVSTDFVESPQVPWFHVTFELLSRGIVTPSQRDEVVQAAPGLTPQDRAVLLATGSALDFIGVLKGAAGLVTSHVALELQRHAGPRASYLTGHRLFLSWDEMRRMQEAGMDIGSHARSHSSLTRMDSGQLQSELKDSKTLLEAQLGRPVTLLAYPNGDFDQRVSEAASEAGYEAACVVGAPRGQRRQHPDFYALPRIGLHEHACAGAFGGFSRSVMDAILGGLWKRPGGYETSGLSAASGEPSNTPGQSEVGA